MRVKVDLRSYFNDHRSFSMLYVDHKMKHIIDLEKLISSMFSIHNFHLKCGDYSGDYFLPSTVPLAMLNEEDIILVCPFEEIEEPSSSTVKKEKRKRKCRKEESCTTDDNENVEQPSVSILSEEKTRKRRLKENGMVESCKKQKLDDNSCILEPSNKKKKVKEAKTNLDSQDAEETNENCDDSISNSERKELGNVKNLVDSFEKKQLNLIQHPEKSINIVKTIILSHPNKSTANATSTPKTSPINFKHVATSNQDHGEHSESVVKADINEEVAEEISSFEKPKRKRVRKRKRQVKNSEPIVEQPTTTPLIPRPLIIKSCSKHVHFDDVESNNINELSTQPNSPQTLENDLDSSITNNVLKSAELEKPNISTKNDHIEDEINLATFENIVTAETCSVENGEKEEAKPKENVPNEVAIAKKEFDSCSLSEEVIAKQPNIPYLKPTLGDIVAFKVLRINESYTPEISSYIVGKVTNFSNETKDISFDIIYGQDQYREPHGKFFLDEEQEDETQKEIKKNLQKTHKLNDLFFSNLLFP